jgi:hypothetical protein
MATTVDTLLVRIEADMSDIKRDLNRLQKDTIKATTAAGASFQKLGRVINVAAVGVIALSIGRAGKAAIDLAGDVAEMQSKSAVVFGQFRDQVVADLTEFGSAVGRSSFELEGMASSIQDTFVPMGFARGEAAQLSVELTKLAVDVASFNNASDTDTMEAFQSALVGNHETVRRFGVVITEATLKQELLRMGIKRTGDEVTNAEKVQARLNLITAGTTDAQGDAARTADSYANQTKALGAEVSQLALDIGRELLPLATDLVELFRDGVGVTRSFLQAIGVLSEFGRDAEGVAKQIQKLNNEIAFLEDPANNSFFVNEQAKIDLKKNLLETLEAQLLAQQALASVEMDNIPSADTDNGGDGSDFDLFNKNQRALAKEIVLRRRQLELQKELKAAKETGNQASIREAEVNIALFDIQKKNDDLLAPFIEKTLAVALASGNYASVTDTLSVSLANANASLSMFDSSLSQNHELIQEGIDFIAQNVAANTSLTESQNALNAALAANAIGFEDYQAAMALLSLEQARTLPLFGDFENGMLSMADNIGGALADMSQGAQLTFRDFQKMIDAFVRDMIAQAIKLLIVNAILRAMGVPLRYDGSGFKAGKGTAFGGEIQESATGGAMSRGRPYLVGERGPELIIPASSGTIKNAHDTRNAMKGGATVVNQTINVETGVSQTVRAEMLSLLPVIKQDTLAAVADGKRRGGSFGQVLS